MHECTPAGAQVCACSAHARIYGGACVLACVLTRWFNLQADVKAQALKDDASKESEKKEKKTEDTVGVYIHAFLHPCTCHAVQ